MAAYSNDAMRADIYWIDQIAPHRLAIMPRPRGGDWLEDEIQSLRLEGVDVLVSLLTEAEARELELDSEAELCRTSGIDYISFPIRDRGSRI